MKEIKEIEDNSLFDKLMNDFNDDLNTKVSIFVLKARIEENESFREMAKIHMDNRAILVVDSRLEELNSQLNLLTSILKK